MTDHRTIKAYQDLDGFILLEQTEHGMRQLASHPTATRSVAVVGKDTEGEYFIIPCKGTRDTSFVEIKMREYGCTEVQTLPIKDIR